MSDAIEDARKLIAARLAELESEAKRLERALASLRGSAPAKRRAPRGQRREHFLTALAKTPGAKATKIAAQLGISANQAYTLAGRLRREGAIRMRGKGYRLAAAKARA